MDLSYGSVSRPSSRTTDKRSRDVNTSVTTSEKSKGGAEPRTFLSPATVPTCEFSLRVEKTDIAELSGQGTYQRMLMACTVLAGFILTSYTNALEVLQPPTDHWCRRLPAFAHLDPAVWKNMSIPVDEEGRYDPCHRYDPPDTQEAENRSVVPCEDWEFDLEKGAANIVSEWRLVCDRKWLLTGGRVAYMLVAVVAVPLCGHISDVVGRRPVVCFSTVVLILAVFAGCFANTFPFFVVNRMVVSATISVIAVTSFVLLFEANTQPYRVYHSLLVHVGINLGFFTSSILSRFHLDYRFIQALFTLPASLLLAVVYVAEESPRWLVATWDIARASHAILWIGRVNGKAVEMEPFMAALKRNERIAGDVSQKPVRALVESRKLRSRLLILCLCRFFITFTLQGLIISERELHIAWLKSLSLVMRVPALVATYFAVTRYGRSKVFQTTIFLTCTGTLALSMSRMEKGVVVSAALSVLTNTADTAALFTLYVYSMELFPTIVRIFSFCASFAFGRIGGAAAPSLIYIASKTHVSMPFVLMTAVGLACHYVVQYLPETKSLVLIDAVEELDEEALNKKLRAIAKAGGERNGIRRKRVSDGTLPQKKKRLSIFNPWRQ